MKLQNLRYFVAIAEQGIFEVPLAASGPFNPH
jgi:hypothetical protein